MNNLDLEIQNLDEDRQMRNLANAIQLADGFSLLFVRCNQRPRQKEIIEELKGKLDGYNIKIIFLDHQIEHLLDELQRQIGDKQYDAIFVYGLESSFPKADEAAESPFVVTLNHARNSFKKVLNCPLVLFLPEYALSAIYHGATDFYSIRSGVYIFSLRAEETEMLLDGLSSLDITASKRVMFKDRQDLIKALEQLLAEYQSLPKIQRDFEKESVLKAKLAEFYVIAADYRKAQKLYLEIIKYCEETENLQLLVQTLSALGINYKLQGKFADATKAYERAMKIGKVFGSNSGQYAILTNNLGVVYRLQGKFDEAIALYTESLKITEKLIGKNNPDYASQLNNLASVFQYQGRYDEAIKTYNESLEILEKMFGKTYPDYAMVLGNLGKTYFEKGVFQKALTLLKESYAIKCKTIGQDHPETLSIKEMIEMIAGKVKAQTSRLIPYKN